MSISKAATRFDLDLFLNLSIDVVDVLKYSDGFSDVWWSIRALVLASRGVVLDGIQLKVPGQEAAAN